MVSQKDLKILVFLFERAKEQKGITIEELAATLAISNRTVRNNLERIDYYLKLNHLPPLKRERKNGIFLDLEPEDLEKYKKLLLEMNTDNYVLSKEERIMYIKLLLFDAEEYLTYEQLSQALFVSRKTVIDDVHVVKEDCEARGIKLLGTKHGLKYESTELELRRLLIDSLLEMFTPLELWEILRDIYPNKSIIIEKMWRRIAGENGIGDCEEKLRAAEQKGKAAITDAQYYVIIVLTVLSGKRRMEERVAKPGNDGLKVPWYLKEYFEKMRKSKVLDFRAEDENYLLAELHRIFNLENMEKSEELSLALTDHILLKVSEKTKKSYYNDEELRSSLQKHLISLIENSFVSYDTDMKNIRAMIEENPILYQCIRQCLSQFSEEELHMNSEREDALLMLHFLAADERRYMQNSVNYSTIIVCNNGVGTAKIVSARVKQYFPQIRIITTTAVRSAGKIIHEERPDFIISTVPFEYLNIPVILVNTLPTEEDIKKIRLFLDSNGRLNQKFIGDSVYTRVMKAISETCEIRDKEQLQLKLSRIFPVEEPQVELLDALTEKEIQLGLEVDGFEDAIRQGAKPLVEQGFVTPKYVDCMVQNVKTMGPYIVITKGIALPHALSTDGVLRSSISLATLKDSVSFGHRMNDPVKLLICIATIDKKEHMREMVKLIQFISDKELVRKVNEAKAPEEILKLIRQMHEYMPVKHEQQ
ncbi:PTS sugar transporter subunit IIA [Candidatus Merdisoma sp. JLR.KK006]|uniref:BglG family transcription antiterminator n=1 Tax=Candidatus Merdisoma sp. JLR.KK006 TaxID=3112626 RepID=UPI002FEED7E5